VLCTVRDEFKLAPSLLVSGKALHILGTHCTSELRLLTTNSKDPVHGQKPQILNVTLA